VRRRLALLLVLAATAAGGETGPRILPPECAGWPQKPAWEWTLEERVRHRLDPDCLTARRALAARDRGQGSVASGNSEDFVFGTDTPELLLPTDLYGHLLSTAFSRNEGLARPYRARYERRAAELQLPVDFWQLVEEAGGEYLSRVREERALMEEFASSDPARREAHAARTTEIRSTQCSDRARALARTRKALSGSLFDRFLYVAVAPGLTVSRSPASPEMLFRSEGCSGSTGGS